MRKNGYIRINGDFVNAFLYKNKITHTEFSEKMGYSQAWWAMVKHQRNYNLKEATVERMCEVYGFKRHEIVVGENQPQANMEENTPLLIYSPLCRFCKILMNE